MKKFMCEDFLLNNETAKTLYHNHAKNMPIFDYHCHLIPSEIAQDKKYNNITEIWLYGDHYKWRAMRSFGHAKNMPIFDYHCHLIPSEIAQDKKYNNITEIWLYGDHYKWRAMRSFGIDEYYITGDASDFEKFKAFAKAMPYLIGNPIYHWSHLELKRYFGVEETLSEKNAEEIWNKCNDVIQNNNFSAKSIIMQSNVKYIATR